MPESLIDQAAKLQQEIDAHEGEADTLSPEDKNRKTAEMKERARAIREEAELVEDDEVKNKLIEIEEALNNLDEDEDETPATTPPATPAAAPQALPVKPNIFSQGIEKATKFFSNASTGMLKGIKVVLALCGLKDLAEMLNQYIENGEVHDMLKNTLGDGKNVKKDSVNDAASIRKLRTQYQAMLKATGQKAEEKTFLMYCEEKAEKLATMTFAPPITEYTIADLLKVPVDDSEKAKPGEEGKPGEEKKESKETPEHKEAKYTFALAAALNITAKSPIVALDDAAATKDLAADKPEYYKTVAKNILEAFTQPHWIGTLSRWGEYTGISPIKEAKTVEPLGLHLSGEMLEARDKTNWVSNDNQIDNFRTMILHNPELAVDELLNHKFESGLSKVKMPVFQARLRERLAKDGLTKAEVIPPTK